MAELAPVFVDLKLRGAEQFKADLKGIAQAAEQQEQRIQRSQRTTTSKAASESKRAAKSRVDANERAYKELERQAHRWEREELASTKRKNAAIEREERRKNTALEREEKRSQAARKASARSLAAGITGGVGRVVGTGFRMAGTIAAAAGGFSVIDAASQGIRNQYRAQQIANQTGLSRDSILANASTTAQKYGMSQDSLLGALDSVVAIGGKSAAGQASKILPGLAELSSATGADIEDLAKSAGSILNTNKGMSSESLLTVLRGTIAAGREGAIDIKDLAKDLGSYAASAGIMAGDQGKNIATLLNIGQKAVEKGGATNSAEAATAVERGVANQIKNVAGFKKLGVDSIKDGKAADFVDTMMQSFVATKGSTEKLMGPKGVYADVKVRQAVMGPLIEFQEFYKQAKKDGKSEQAALQEAAEKTRDGINKFSKETLTAAQVTKEAQAQAATVQARLNVLYEKVQAALQSKILPALERVDFDELGETILTVIDKFASLAEWVSTNPFKAIGGLILLEIAKGFAPSVIQSAMTAAFSGGAGGAAGILGPVGSAALAVAIGAAIGAAIGNYVVEDAQADGVQSAADGKAGSKMVKESRLLYNKSMGGTKLSPEERKQLERNLQEASYVADRAAEHVNDDPTFGEFIYDSFSLDSAQAERDRKWERQQAAKEAARKRDEIRARLNAVYGYETTGLLTGGVPGEGTVSQDGTTGLVGGDPTKLNQKPLEKFSDHVNNATAALEKFKAKVDETNPPAPPPAVGPPTTDGNY